eukprot:494133-Alexandrium_andersonii.AAC.1
MDVCEDGLEEDFDLEGALTGIVDEAIAKGEIGEPAASPGPGPAAGAANASGGRARGRGRGRAASSREPMTATAT